MRNINEGVNFVNKAHEIYCHWLTMDIIDALKRFGELDWYEASPGRKPTPDQKQFVPLIAWRFVTPNEHVEARIEAALKGYRGSVEWEVEMIAGYTWVLVPKRVAALRREERLRDIIEAVAKVASEDPEFGLAAHNDLKEITDLLGRLSAPDTAGNMGEL